MKIVLLFLTIIVSCLATELKSITYHDPGTFVLEPSDYEYSTSVTLTIMDGRTTIELPFNSNNLQYNITVGPITKITDSDGRIIIKCTHIIGEAYVKVQYEPNPHAEFHRAKGDWGTRATLTAVVLLVLYMISYLCFRLDRYLNRY